MLRGIVRCHIIINDYKNVHKVKMYDVYSITLY